MKSNVTSPPTPSPHHRFLNINIKLDAFRNFSLNSVFNHRVVFYNVVSLTLRYVFYSSYNEKIYLIFDAVDDPPFCNWGLAAILP